MFRLPSGVHVPGEKTLGGRRQPLPAGAAPAQTAAAPSPRTVRLGLPRCPQMCCLGESRWQRPFGLNSDYLLKKRIKGESRHCHQLLAQREAAGTPRGLRGIQGSQGHPGISGAPGGLRGTSGERGHRVGLHPAQCADSNFTFWSSGWLLINTSLYLLFIQLTLSSVLS